MRRLLRVITKKNIKPKPAPPKPVSTKVVLMRGCCGGKKK